MPDQTVTQIPDEKPDPFHELAYELHAMADALDGLVGSGLPKPIYVGLSIHGGRNGDDESVRLSVDAIGQALLGVNGRARLMSGGSYHYGTEQTSRGPVNVQVYNSVSTKWAERLAHEAELAEKEAELARLRAEVEQLRSGRKAES
jgi:hypothetical protein